MKMIASKLSVGNALGRLFFAGVLLLIEMIAVLLLYNGVWDYGCPDLASETVCKIARGSPVRLIAVGSVFAISIMAASGALQELAQGMRPRFSRGWLTVNLFGFVLMLTPALSSGRLSPSSWFGLVVPLLLLGAVAAMVGAALALASTRAWRDLTLRLGPISYICLLAAFFWSDVRNFVVETTLGAAWGASDLARVTLHSVAALLSVLGETPITGAGRFADESLLGVGDFVADVAVPCSGVEGMTIQAGFISIFLVLFRRELRFPHAFVLIPVAVMASFALNTLRIAALVMIGAYISPQLAVSGFHSYAGWLMFTLLALSIVAAALSISWFRKRSGPKPARMHGEAPRVAPPFWSDPVAARILPFVVFMATALLSSTFSETPALYYPLRALAVTAALIGFHRVMRAMPWRLDPAAALVGAAVGVAWLATAPAAQESDAALNAALTAAPAWLFVLWATSRILGTTLLVPVVEEFFFRGYVLRRLDMGGPAMRVLAVAVSTGLFAALHDRWIAAGLAGLAFALLALRRRDGLVDAVLAHAVANALIAAWALRTGDWSLI